MEENRKSKELLSFILFVFFSYYLTLLNEYLYCISLFTSRMEECGQYQCNQSLGIFITTKQKFK